MIADLSLGDLVRVTRYSSYQVRMVVKVKEIIRDKAYVANRICDSTKPPSSMTREETPLSSLSN